MTGTTSVDAAAPVLIGVGQAIHRDRHAATSAAALITAAAEAALTDTAVAGNVRRRVSTVGVTHCLSWPAGNPAGVLAGALGITGPRTLATHPGGTAPLDLLHHACAGIRAGDDGVTLLAGGEAIRALTRGHRGDPDPPTGPPDAILGSDRAPSHPDEERAGLFQPLDYYPLFEVALRAAGGPAGRTAGGHQKWLGDLWSRFAEVAAGNPYAPLAGDPPDADRIATPGPGNRMVAHPYPKLMTANINVDQAAAVLLCSAGTAAAAGVPRDRWVFVAASSAANDHWHVVEREHLHRSPAIAATGRAALGHAGLGVDDLAHLDVYSCFPSAVQVAATELGIDLRLRTPTVTGGLTFAGGPASSYVLHSLAVLVDRLRAAGDGAALATAVGWFLTKHAMTVLSADPPRRAYRHTDAQSTVDRLPRRPVAGHPTAATVETWTVGYDRDGVPNAAYLTGLLPDGARAVAGSTAPDTVAAVLATDPTGLPVRLAGDGTFTT